MDSRELYETIKNSYDIVEVVSSFVNLKRVGRNYVGLCPFHSEKTPSFVVSPEKQIFKCFGCGVAGDVVTFYMKIKGISFWEALKELGERIGIEVKFKGKDPERESQKEKLVSLCYKIARYYHKLLYVHSEAERAREYLKKRDLKEETLKEFLIGFAPSEGRVLSFYLKTLNIPLEDAQKLGIIKKQEGDLWIDFFKNRIIFPIFNQHGECVGFGGRSLESDEKVKYLNTPETPIYKKSEILYGFFHSKKFIKEKGKGFLVEGYFDFLTLWDKGIKNVVATCGTALTSRHVELLKNLDVEWTIFYDGDEAGIKAMMRAIKLFLDREIIPFCLVPPEGEDPDSWIRKLKEKGLSDEELENLLETEKKDGLDFVLEHFSSLVRENPARAFQELKYFFQDIENPFLKKKIYGRIASFYGITEDEVRRFLEGKKKISFEETGAFQESLHEPEDMELKIIAQFILNYPEELEKLKNSGLLTLLKSKKSCYSSFVLFLIEKIEKQDFDFEFFPDPKFQEFYTDLLFSPPFEESKEEILRQILRYLHLQIHKEEVKKVLQELKKCLQEGKKEKVTEYLWLLKEVCSLKSYGDK